MNPYMDSEQAAQTLGVHKATLYSYVSRGLLQSFAGDTRRERKFRRADVKHLAARLAQARKPRQVARTALDWGLPVMESGLTLIENGQLFYRGVKLEDLLPAASLEEIAHLLWQCPPESIPMSGKLRLSGHWHGLAGKLASRSATERVLPLFALGQAEIALGLPADAFGFDAGQALLQLLAACVFGKAHPPLPMHEQCRAAWGLDARGTQIVRTALVACADHELNASSFTARCIASTGAAMGPALVGALSALTGSLHGGHTEKIEMLFDELASSPSIAQGLAAHAQRNGGLPGFGHPLYPGGDPRAAALLDLLPENRTLRHIMGGAEDLTGLRPSVDFALVAVRRCLGLPRGSAFGIFAMARTVGWIAHILEQRRQPGLIRPRANYVGPRPEQNGKKSAGRIIRFGLGRGLPAGKSAHD